MRTVLLMRRKEVAVSPLRLAARQFASGLDDDFGVVTLYVVAAIAHADVIRCRKVGCYLILKARGHGARGRCLAGRPTRAGQHYRWNTRSDRAGMNLFTSVQAVIDLTPHDPRHE